MSEKRIRFGLIGCGNVSRIYLESIKRNPNTQLIATCDVVEERAKALMKEGNAEAFYLDYNEMLEKAKIDAVIIITSIDSHAKIAAEAARAGKHMLIQKSMATSLKDADEVVRSVRKARVKAVVEPSPHLSPWNQRAKKLIEDGAIGKVCYVHGIGSIWDPGAAWYYMKEHGGGPIFNMAVYPVSNMTFILGPVRRVTSMATFSIPEREINGSKVKITAEDNTITLLDFGRGVLGCVESNYVTRFLPSDMFFEGYCRFHGSEGTIIVSRDMGVQLASNDKTYWAYDNPGWFKPIVQIKAFGNWAASFWYYYASIDHLVECILADEEPLPNVEWGRHVTEILEKSVESARQGKTLNLRTSF